MEPEEKSTIPQLAEIILRPVCGLIMPISSIDGCPEDHWQEVKDIVSETVENSGFEAQMVNEANDSGIIQKRIVQHLYDDPVVICDVSGKNPNVMFELGMRLAFDKPTIIIKDDKTTYSFDTAPIEHLEYPRDLRFNQIVAFKSELMTKIKATYEKSKVDKNYSTFLKHFGSFNVPKIDTNEIPKERFILEELQQMRKEIGHLSIHQRISPIISRTFSDTKERNICLRECPEEVSEHIFLDLIKRGGAERFQLNKKGSNRHTHISFTSSLELATKLLAIAREILPTARLL